MAIMIPEALPSSGPTPGERKVFAALSHGLSDGFVVYSELPVSRRYADFVVIGRDLYIGMTRARRQLYVTFHGASPLMSELCQLQRKIA